LQVAPITVLKTEYREQVLHQISCNSTYICYGLKAGHIRALNKENANRALFKGHTSMVSTHPREVTHCLCCLDPDPWLCLSPPLLKQVADMQFSSPSSNVLASVDVTGHVYIRRLSEGDGGGTVQVCSHELQEQEQEHGLLESGAFSVIAV
jgi:hypothetical protein